MSVACASNISCYVPLAKPDIFREDQFMAVGLFTMIVMLFLLVPKVDDSSTSLMTKTSFALSLSHDKHDSTLVLLLALDSLHVVIHVHESTQPGSVEGSITAWGVHSHLRKWSLMKLYFKIVSFFLSKKVSAPSGSNKMFQINKASISSFTYTHLLLVANPFFRNECIVLALECGFVFI